MKLITLITGLLVAISGCKNIPTTEEAPDESLKGTVTSEGHLIFFEWTTYEGGKQRHTAALRDDYGMMIFYDSFVKASVPRFELYSHVDKSIYQTHCIEDFKRALSRIPPGKKLHCYNTCAGGTHHGLDANVIVDIRDFCKDREIVFQNGDDELFTICTCP
jgi:hypothetical protein